METERGSSASQLALEEPIDLSKGRQCVDDNPSVPRRAVSLSFEIRCGNPPATDPPVKT
jgi:hypothetical protein